MYDIYVRLDSLDETETEDKVLWAPGLADNGYILYSASLELKLNHSGKLTFHMSPKHPLYGKLKNRKSRVVVHRKGVEIWRGRVLNVKTDFYKRQTVVCEGMLSWLLDTVRRPYSHSGTVHQYIASMLNNHNADCDHDKKFYIGIVNAVDAGTIISVDAVKNTSYPNTLDELNDKLVSQYGGYLRARYDPETRRNYLDYLSSIGEDTDQKIEFGKNLLNLEDYISADEVYTRCIPLGATLREVDSYMKENDPSYISSLKDEDASKRLTIKGLFENDRNRDYLENEPGVTLFGKNITAVTFEGVVTVDILAAMGDLWLSENIAMNVSMEITAIDLAMVTDDVEAIYAGSRVEVVSYPHDVDMYMVCSAVTLDLLSPAQTQYTFGNSFKALTNQQARAMMRSTRAYAAAQAAGTSADNIASTVNGSYVSTDTLNAYKQEVSKSLEDINELPDTTELDNDKTLKVVGGKWTAVEQPVILGLPETGEEDEGKTLQVVGGKWATMDPLPTLPETGEEDEGKTLKVVGGKWTAVTDMLGDITLPEITTGDEGKSLSIKVVDGKLTAALE